MSTFQERMNDFQPVLIPADATEEEELRLRFPVLPPPPGSEAAKRWTALDLEPKVSDSSGST